MFSAYLSLCCFSEIHGEILSSARTLIYIVVYYPKGRNSLPDSTYSTCSFTGRTYNTCSFGGRACSTKQRRFGTVISSGQHFSPFSSRFGSYSLEGPKRLDVLRCLGLELVSHGKKDTYRAVIRFAL